MSEIRDARLDRLEADLGDIRGTLARLEPMFSILRRRAAPQPC